LPLALCSRNGAGPKDVANATATLLWIDEPFAVTAAHVVQAFLQRRVVDGDARVWLGEFQIPDFEHRIVTVSPTHDLATFRVAPEELMWIGREAAFCSPHHWPPEPVTRGEEVVVLGYPRDQWPAQLRFTFHVESATARRFGATLRRVDMPASLSGLSGAPAFRVGRGAEFVGVVVDTLFHNEVVRAQHALHLNRCGTVADGHDAA
jgi:hypothetical protein